MSSIGKQLFLEEGYETPSPEYEAYASSSFSTPQQSSLKRKRTQDTLESAYEKFKASVYYHGTSKQSKKIITKYGMDVQKKIAGCSDILLASSGVDDQAAKYYNYIMSRSSAANYAKMHDEPAILALFVLNGTHLERDPEGYNKDEFRTTSTIPPLCILTGKRLSRRRCNFLVNALGISLSQENEEKLFDKVDAYIEKKLKKIPKYLENAIDFKAMESERHAQTVQALAASGISFEKLKEGDTLTVNL
jgi:hypothetical protein